MERVAVEETAGYFQLHPPRRLLDRVLQQGCPKPGRLGAAGIRHTSHSPLRPRLGSGTYELPVSGVKIETLAPSAALDEVTEGWRLRVGLLPPLRDGVHHDDLWRILPEVEAKQLAAAV